MVPLMFHLLCCISVNYLVDMDYNWPVMQYILEVAAIYIFELLLVTVFKLGCCL
jgi:uncharacterized protein HemY